MTSMIGDEWYVTTGDPHAHKQTYSFRIPKSEIPDVKSAAHYAYDLLSQKQSGRQLRLPWIKDHPFTVYDGIPGPGNPGVKVHWDELSGAGEWGSAEFVDTDADDDGRSDKEELLGIARNMKS